MAPPTAAEATTLANYSVPGLTLSGVPSLAGSTVTITTSPQGAATYTVTVTGVTRASDASPLAVNTASFTHTTFNVASAASLTSHSMRVTFDAPPNAGQATTLANYSVLGLTLSGVPSLAGNTVTITTSTQAASTYTVNVAGVTAGQRWHGAHRRERDVHRPHAVQRGERGIAEQRLDDGDVRRGADRGAGDHAHEL